MHCFLSRVRPYGPGEKRRSDDAGSAALASALLLKQGLQATSELKPPKIPTPEALKPAKPYNPTPFARFNWFPVGAILTMIIFLILLKVLILLRVSRLYPTRTQFRVGLRGPRLRKVGLQCCQELQVLLLAELGLRFRV